MLKIRLRSPLAAGLFLPAHSLAQAITGSITGTVTDPSGAVIPNVKVTAANEATNVTNDTQTNQAGVYTFPFLPLGSYTITAEQQGFKKTATRASEPSACRTFSTSTLRWGNSSASASRSTSTSARSSSTC